MKKIITLFLVLISSDAYSCSFLLERSSAYPKLVSAVIIIFVSFCLLIRCYPSKKKLILLLVASLEAIPIFFIIINWNEFDICASKVVFPAYVALLIAIIILLVTLNCVLWKSIKTKRSELTD
jgi:hypothetical protein